MPPETATTPAAAAAPRRRRARPRSPAPARALGDAARRPADRHGDRRPGALAGVPDRRLVHHRLARPLEVALMALALTLVIVAAEIDLSVASSARALERADGGAVERRLPLELIMPICLVAGALCGAFNGLLVTRLGLPSLAVTIGTLALFRGLAFVIIGDESVTDFPADVDGPGLRQRRRHVHPEHDGAVRDPRRRVRRGCCTRRRSGARSSRSARTRRPRTSRACASSASSSSCSCVSGTVAALAGIVISLRNSTAAANVGQGFELTAITAVLLGGVSIFGGRGTIGGSSSRCCCSGASRRRSCSRSPSRRTGSRS